MKVVIDTEILRRTITSVRNLQTERTWIGHQFSPVQRIHREFTLLLGCGGPNPEHRPASRQRYREGAGRSWQKQPPLPPRVAPNCPYGYVSHRRSRVLGGTTGWTKPWSHDQGLAPMRRAEELACCYYNRSEYPVLPGDRWWVMPNRGKRLEDRQP